MLRDKKASTLLLSICMMAPEVFSEDAFYDAASSGKVTFDSRLRYENANQDNALKKDASALTLRTRLGYLTKTFYQTSAFIEMSNVQIVGGVDHYAPESTGYSKIADPEITRLNQAYLKTATDFGLTTTIGRQRIILDNARFVGNVGWRQTEQTFDAVRVNYQIDQFNTNISYIWHVNGIMDSLNTDASDLLVNASYMTDFGKITGYYYGLDHEDSLDMGTYGARFSGKHPINEAITLTYSAEFAAQQAKRFKGTNIDADAQYIQVSFGGSYENYGLAAGYEILGSDNGQYGFQTPLATKHGYNGWADLFLVTPADGLRDLSVRASATLAGVKLAAIYHDYTADKKSESYGSEIDLVAIKKFAKKYAIGAKYANYSASDYAVAQSMTDTNKFWIWAQMTF